MHWSTCAAKPRTPTTASCSALTASPPPPSHPSAAQLPLGQGPSRVPAQECVGGDGPARRRMVQRVVGGARHLPARVYAQE